MLTKISCIILFCLFSITARAQLCQGSLGDPLVNIDFGHGPDPGPPISAAATGYQFVSSDCPSDGFYTVRTNSNSCFGNTWHSLSSDHTGDPNGYFMLVNAALQPSAFYVDTVKGLCGNSTYEFAAWVLNIILSNSCSGNSSRPDLTFTIETTTGTILKSYNSGQIQPTGSPTWKQYGFFFTTPPAGSDIVLRIVNNAAGGCGNDLALDDITFRPCGPQLTPSVTGQSTTNVNACEGVPASFTFNCTVSGGFINPAFIWQQRVNAGNWTDIIGANATTLTRSFPSTSPLGKYEYRLSVAEAGNLGSPQCRISSTPIAVTVNAKPIIIASNDGPICVGGTATLTASGAAFYMWAGMNGYTASGTSVLISNTQPANSGLYTVTGTSAAGCVNSSTTSLSVNPIPTAGLSPVTAIICQRDSVALQATGGVSYRWFPTTGISQPAAASVKAAPSSNITYQVEVSNGFGCTDTASTTITVYERAIASAGPDRLVIKGQTITLEGRITGQYQQFSWTPTIYMLNPQVIQPFITPLADTSYILNVISNNGCGTSSDTVEVKVFNGIYIPSAFTPNGDGLNGTWSIPALNAFPGFELKVYDRYGHVVFENRDVNLPWNGTYKGQDVSPGVYVYVIDLKKAPGVLKGTIMVLR